MMIYPSANYLRHFKNYLFFLLAFGKSLPLGSSLQGRSPYTIISLSPTSGRTYLRRRPSRPRSAPPSSCRRPPPPTRPRSGTPTPRSSPPGTGRALSTAAGTPPACSAARSSRSRTGRRRRRPWSTARAGSSGGRRSGRSSEGRSNRDRTRRP